jgi:aspartyl-tRNA(Asn)/glutamyl-tRNA(Gln) amidotransferase subunit A
MAELHWKSALELSTMVRQRELKASELMAATIERIEELNPTINAFCALRCEQAMDEAKALDARLSRGEQPGLLAGLPLGVKDLENAAGMATTYGSVPFKDNIAAADSIQVARLKAAGAIVLGKTNTPEFGHTGFTKNLLFGTTRNPWNLDRTPGGSSGGSAAAIAAGMVPLATASDGGGSIRIPACYTGTFGLKPSQGRVPLDLHFGVQEWNDLIVLGPITRTVKDAALYLDAAAGYHPADPSSLPHPGLSYCEVLERPLRRLRIAFHRDFGRAKLQPDVLSEVEQAVKVFGKLGHEVDVLNEPVPETALEWARLFFACRQVLLRDWIERYRSQFNRTFLAALELGDRLGWEEMVAAQRKRADFNRWLQKVFARYDLLLTPTLPTEAFAADGPPGVTAAGRLIEEVFQQTLAGIVFTYPFNFSGHPAASVRAGFTSSGMPCGLQIVAERHREDLVLQAAYAYEQARPWNDRWPTL